MTQNLHDNPLVSNQSSNRKNLVLLKSPRIDDKNGNEGIFLGERIAQHSKRTQVGWAQFL